MKRILTLVAVVGLIGRASAQQILLQVDVVTPGGPTYFATGAAPLIDDSSATAVDGITLRNIYTTPFLRQNNVPGGNLAADGIVFNRVDNSSSASKQDLNWFTVDNGNILDFTTSAAAFTGSSVGPGGPIQAVGFIGDIIAGWNSTSGGGGGSRAVIGQYQIVPEPAALLLLGLGAVSLMRRRRA